MPVVDVPATPEQRAFREFVRGLLGRTVADVFDQWALTQDGTLTIRAFPSGAEIDPDDAAYDSWTVCNVLGSEQGDLCVTPFPAGGYDATLHAFEHGCRRSTHRAAGETNTTRYVSCPVCIRLYTTPTHLAGGNATAESLAAPDLGTADRAAGWTVAGVTDAFEYGMLYDHPGESGAGSGGSGTWSGVNVPAAYYGIGGFVYRISGDLLTAVQSGGSATAQFRAHSRSGIGISEPAQNHYAAWAIRVYRPGSGFVATLFAVGTAGATKFFAGSPSVNRTWASSFTGYAGALDGDYLVIDIGTQHVGPTTGGTGASHVRFDNAGSDLPQDESTTTDLNSWIEICG